MVLIALHYERKYFRVHKSGSVQRRNYPHKVNTTINRGLYFLVNLNENASKIFRIILKTGNTNKKTLPLQNDCLYLFF